MNILMQTEIFFRWKNTGTFVCDEDESMNLMELQESATETMLCGKELVFSCSQWNFFSIIVKSQN